MVIIVVRDVFLIKWVGDILLFMGVVVILVLVGSMNFSDLYEWVERVEIFFIMVNLLGLVLIVGLIGKCV